MQRSSWTVFVTGLLLLTACGGDGQASPSSSSTGSTGSTASTAATSTQATTSQPATTAAPGTTQEPITDVSQVDLDAQPATALSWRSRCADDNRGGAVATVVSESSLNAFGPISPQPGLTITLPRLTGSIGIIDPEPTMVRIAGGIVVAGSKVVRNSDGDAAAEGSVVVAVDHDGSVRWMRCLSHPATVSAYTADAVLLHMWQGDDTSRAVDLPMSVVDGSFGDNVAPPATPRAARWVTTDSPDNHYRLMASGNAVLWEDTTLFPCEYSEERYWSAGDDVTILSGCTGGAYPDGLGTRVTRGYDTATGRKLWQIDGWYLPGLVADGFALMRSTVPSGAAGDNYWVMVDATTGRAVNGQRWNDPTTFDRGCCDDTYTLTQLAGGLVLHSSQGFDGTIISVYYPIAAGVTPHTVDLS